MKIPIQSTNNFVYLIYSTITSSYRHLHPAVLIASKLHKLGTTQCKMLLQSYDHASRRNSLLFISCHLKLEREGGGFCLLIVCFCDAPQLGFDQSKKLQTSKFFCAVWIWLSLAYSFETTGGSVIIIFIIILYQTWKGD